jgi:antitoxin (DNA-binding transcriptional repressor) of toxin-antitoxin stability system
MKITASKLREDVYRILDEIIETGQEVEILRKGVVIRMVPAKKTSKISRLKKHDYSDENADFFTHIDWTSTRENGLQKRYSTLVRSTASKKSNLS